MRSTSDMFVYFLNDMYSIESATLALTKDLANKAKNPLERQDLETHIEETRRQMHRLESIIHRYGSKISVTKATAFSFLSLGTNVFQWAQTNRKQEELRMLYDAIMLEHMEIGGYKALIAIAKSLGDTQSATELLLNLEEEMNMADRAERQIFDATKKVA